MNEPPVNRAVESAEKRTMNIHSFEHVPFEDTGSIYSFIQKKGFHWSHTLFYKGESLPDPDSIDMLIIMGGPMSVNDEKTYPWLKQEKRFIRSMIDMNKPVLGICLGAQLIASALEAPVFKGNEKEIGWFSIHGERGISSDLFQFPPELHVFHWHGETFDLPRDAKRLASSRFCRNQAFQLGQNVIGLQFHLETTRASAARLIENCREELIEAPGIQKEKQIMSESDASYQEIHRWMEKLITYLLP